MELDTMMEAAVETFKQKMREACKDFDDQTLCPQLAEQVTGALKPALASAGVAALGTFWEGDEIDAPSVLSNETVDRFKQESPKTLLTPFGQMTLARNLYQADAGGPCSIPLEATWGMTGEFATMEVREAVLFAWVHITPEETVALLQKSALLQPSATAGKPIVEETGDFLEEQAEEINQAIRTAETVPEATRGLVASLDGVNVRLTEPGNKRGRPTERPGNPTEQTTPTAYKNAVVGSLSVYGAPSPDKEKPERLLSRYVAQMPEQNAPTLKDRFEEELDPMEVHLPDGTIKILLFDGARGLWNSVTDNPRFEAYETLIDFYHSTEHLSKAAELLFGKVSVKATQWYEPSSEKLLKKKGAAAGVARSITYHMNLVKRSGKRKNEIERERIFFSRNQPKMTSADFRARGLPIGSGPVEAACKTIVKTRLGRSGMHWSWHGGQRILQLRTYVKSQRWDAFWQEYKTRRAKPIEHGDLANAA